MEELLLFSACRQHEALFVDRSIAIPKANPFLLQRTLGNPIAQYFSILLLVVVLSWLICVEDLRERSVVVVVSHILMGYGEMETQAKTTCKSGAEA